MVSAVVEEDHSTALTAVQTDPLLTKPPARIFSSPEKTKAGIIGVPHGEVCAPYIIVEIEVHAAAWRWMRIVKVQQ